MREARRPHAQGGSELHMVVATSEERRPHAQGGSELPMERCARPHAQAVAGR